MFLTCFILISPLFVIFENWWYILPRVYLGKVSCIKIMVVKLPVLKYVIIPYAIFSYSIFAFSPYFFEHLNHIPYSLTCMFWSKPHVRKSAKSKYRWTWSYTKWWENVKHVLLRNSWRHVNLSTLEITFCHFFNNILYITNDISLDVTDFQKVLFE